jgi:hypothetical protein
LAVQRAGPAQLWDLRLIREQLAAMNLDWDLPPLPSRPPEQNLGPLTVTILTDTNQPDTKPEEVLGQPKAR